MTPTEQQAAQEVNALDFPVNIQLEDDMIPITDIYGLVQPPEATEAMPGSSTEWTVDNTAGTGDLAKWLHTGFTPRAGGGQAHANSYIYTPKAAPAHDGCQC